MFYLLAHRFDEARHWIDLGRCYQKFNEREQALCFSQAQKRHEQDYLLTTRRLT